MVSHHSAPIEQTKCASVDNRRTKVIQGQNIPGSFKEPDDNIWVEPASQCLELRSKAALPLNQMSNNGN